MSVEHWSKRLYPDESLCDPVKRFVAEVDRLVRPEHEILDIGAGGGHLNRYAYKGRVRRMAGVDLDPRVVDNPLLDDGVVGDVTALPYPDNSFDLAFSIYVLEHIEFPDKMVSEIRRVLRPGGIFLALTPNRFHYVAMISAFTPDRFHRWVNKKRGRDESDTFPTFYRLNSRSAVRRRFGSGFDVEELKMIEVRPNYLTFSLPTFLAGAAYERMVNATELLAGLRVNIIMRLRNRDKPSGTGEA